MEFIRNKNAEQKAKEKYGTRIHSLTQSIQTLQTSGKHTTDIQ